MKIKKNKKMIEISLILMIRNPFQNFELKKSSSLLNVNDSLYSFVFFFFVFDQNQNVINFE